MLGRLVTPPFRSFGLWTRGGSLHKEMLEEFTEMDSFGKNYSNPQRLRELQKSYIKNAKRPDVAYEYIKELNKNGMYNVAERISSDADYNYYHSANPKCKQIEYQKQYARLSLNPRGLYFIPRFASDGTPWRSRSKTRFLMWMLLFAGSYWYFGGRDLLDSNKFGQERKSNLLPSLLSSQIEMEKNIPTRFSDVVGIDQFKEELTEIVDYLRNPDKYLSVGAKLPKGVLLVGPPGTGKTLLARALAGEAGCTFFYKSGSEFDEMFVGLGASRVRKLFKEARQHAPSIIFIDEIDSVAGTRRPGSPSYTRETVNQLLAEIDGFKPSDNVIIIGASNFPEGIDPAMKRPGRFDRIVHIPLPDSRGRQQILDYYLAKIKTTADVVSKQLVKRTIGFSGAELKNMVNTAILNAVRNNRSSATKEDFEHSYDRIRMGIGRKNMYIPPEERRLTAYHEMGHALTSLLTEGAMPLHKVTILPRGGALGFTSMVPEQDALNLNKKAIMALIDVSMGGRVAEELFYGNSNITTGAGSDLKNATQYAYRYVKYYGMNENVNLSSPGSRAHVSDQYNYIIDKEVDRVLKESYQRVKKLLSKHKDQITRVVDVLVEEETLNVEQIKELMKK